MANTFSVERLAYLLICLSIGTALLYIGSSFFIPMVYGLLLAFLLKPACDRIERVLPNRVVAILLSMLVTGLIVGVILFFFAVQVMEIASTADNIAASLLDSWREVTETAGEFFGLTKWETTRLMEQNIADSIDQPWGIVTTGLSISGVVIANFVLVVIYSFFFLLYSTAFKRFVLGQFPLDKQEESMQTMREVQAVATGYLSGVLTVMLILGVLNSVGLYFIGIKYALVWGFLAALLSIIPYIGTTIGGLLPFLYALATTDNLYQPAMVAVLYVTVQTLEGNIITPKVVGNSVKINALAAVVSIILGALIWGLPGVVIAIPILAMVRIIMEHVGPLKPVALLLSDDLYDHSERFLHDFNAPQNRLAALFNASKKQGRRVRLLSPQPPDQVGEPDPQIITNPET
ncbi:AI-2E family transporter [Neolewinella lacunae]|uniref:AI-2E family transporter n=1 Tax=Neolewinella lacunae TaxID=1517758 RepID=UPI0016537C25|nr:AI-2E family transporter [Neolewinella lacunae]MDN3633501.1 AI-2E family transporter [Neolewinella lacunae]